LDDFKSSFADFGITSLDDMCDAELLSEHELVSDIGMSKVRRCAIAPRVNDPPLCCARCKRASSAPLRTSI
jgi:hypothetical protein